MSLFLQEKTAKVYNPPFPQRTILGKECYKNKFTFFRAEHPPTLPKSRDRLFKGGIKSVNLFLPHS